MTSELKQKLTFWRSLKTRVTVFTLTIFVTSLWALAFYASQMLREDMLRLLSEQQVSTASYLAEQVNDELTDRMAALKLIASQVDESLMNNPPALQARIEQHSILNILFNGGVFVTELNGVSIASAPRIVEGVSRIGISYMNRDYMITALREGKPAIGKPVMGKLLQSPVFLMAVPIFDAQGKVTGALAGVINLGKPSFLDKVTQNRYGKTGGYLLVAPQHQLIVTGTDKSRIMTDLPPLGANQFADASRTGFEGSLLGLTGVGAEALVSLRKIPIAAWYMVVMLPAEEVFLPIHIMQQNMLWITVLLTLLAGGLTWWMLRHELAPMLTTAKTLADLSTSNQHPQALPVTRRDEVGELIGGFNRLLKTLALREEALQLAASVFSTSHEGILITDLNGNIVEVNDAFTHITGYSRNDILGKTPRILNSGRQSKDFYAALWLDLNENGHWSGEVWNRRKNGEIYAELLTISTVKNTEGKALHYVALFSDISEMKAHEQQLEHIAHYDALTNLPNRVLLADRLHQAMMHTQRHNQGLAVIYLDLDGFKAVNDNHGHDIGDQLLMVLATRMKQVLRESDTLARIGGDEFVAMLLDATDIKSSELMLNRLLAAAAQPVEISDLVLQVSASIGVTFYPQAEAVDADQLLRQADQAMYQAKLAGRNRFSVFDAEHDSSLRSHHESLDRIRLALEKQEFVLYYQPKVNMRTGSVVGSEALIRWQHPEKGLLPPSVFLPVIEDHHLAIAIGEWVIDTALTQMALWQQVGLDIPVSVNVGARQLQQTDFVENLLTMLASHPNVKPSNLEIEVLETSALEDIAGVSQVIEACRNIGVRFALDDFGTGYSSLTYLRRLPVSVIKIDQSFVRDMLDDPDDLAILEGVLGLAAAFHREVIAEGVETIESGAMLLQLGCDLAQGYGIARPMPAQEMPSWATSWRPDDSWTNCPPINRDDAPILFARIEHRAWINAIDAYLKGGHAKPPIAPHQCHFGQWLDASGLSLHKKHPAFKAISSLQQQAYTLASKLLALHEQGKNAEALEQLSELHRLGNELSEQLKMLPREKRQ